MSADPNELARLVQRTQPGPRIELTDALSSLDRDAAVAAVLDAGAAEVPTPPELDDAWEFGEWIITDRVDSGLDGGLRRMMAWFWHMVLPSHHAKTTAPLLARQAATFRQLALADYRSLLYGYVTDGALLHYLDGNGSVADNPNENLSRELLELYSLGYGYYSEADVRAGARALAGWTVDDETDDVRWDADLAFTGPLTYLGDDGLWDAESVVDRLCADPATARHIAGRVWFHLIGAPPADPEELGRWWSQQDLAILPLVELALSSDEFWNPDLRRPRGGLEWFSAAAAATGGGRTDDGQVELWPLFRLGQLPFEPPTPAGWDDDRWITPGQMLVRASVGYEFGREGPEVDSFDQVLANCLIAEPSEATRTALTEIGERSDNPEDVVAGWWRIALAAPEFQYQ